MTEFKKQKKEVYVIIDFVASKPGRWYFFVPVLSVFLHGLKHDI